MTERELPDVPSLRSIDPPPGGLTRLRAAIDADTDKRRSRVRWVFAAAPLAVVIALVLWNRRDREVIELPSARPIAPALADPQISPAFYWVASTPGPAPGDPRPGVLFTDVAPLTIE